MSEFKAMKFWIGDDPACSERVQKMLFDMGYRWFAGGRDVRHTDSYYITTARSDEHRSGGCLYQGSSKDRLSLSKCEEINIDWLRTPKQETIELNGKNYIKADVEAALEKLKPVGE